FDESFHAETHFACAIHFEDFHIHGLTFTQNFGHCRNATVRDLTDVKKAFTVWHNLNERSEIHNALHKPVVGLTRFWLSHNLVNQAESVSHFSFIARSDDDGSVILNFDLRTGLIDQSANDLPACTDNVSDTILFD